MRINTDQPYNDPALKIGTLRYRIYLVRFTDELDIENFPKPSNATLNLIPLMAGSRMHFLDCSPNSVVPSAAASGNVAPQGKLKIDANVEGISKRTLSWLYENTGERFLVIWVNCKTGEQFIGGGPCGGLMLTYKTLGTQNKGEWQGAEIEFNGDQCPEPILFYEGPIVLEDPTVVAIAGGTFALGTASQYLLPDGVTAQETLTNITGVTDSDVGRIIDLRGAGFSYPVLISASPNFILQNGIDYQASNNSSISFQIAKTGTGTYAFYEVARS